MSFVRIFWIENNGRNGNGDYIPYDTALAFITTLNKKFPHIHHFIVSD